MNAMTGQGDMAALGAPPEGGEEMAVTDIATQPTPGGGEEVMGAEMTADIPADDMGGEMPDEEPEQGPTGGVGREKR
jgi:hypothetical protein